MHPPTQADDGLTRFLAAIPKAELHCHLLGTVRRSTFEGFARRAYARGDFRATADTTAADAPPSSADIEAFYTRSEKPGGVLRVLRALDRWLLTEPDDFHRLTYEYLEDAAAHEVRYAEFFWNPTGTARVWGLSYPRVLEAMCGAIADAQHDHGIVTPTGAWTMMARDFGDSIDDLRASLEAGLDAAWIESSRAWAAASTRPRDCWRSTWSRAAAEVAAGAGGDVGGRARGDGADDERAAKRAATVRWLRW